MRLRNAAPIAVFGFFTKHCLVKKLKKVLDSRKISIILYDIFEDDSNVISLAFTLNYNRVIKATSNLYVVISHDKPLTQGFR